MNKTAQWSTARPTSTKPQRPKATAYKPLGLPGSGFSKMVRPTTPPPPPPPAEKDGAYIQGFMDKCAAMGVNPEALVKLAVPAMGPPLEAGGLRELMMDIGRPMPPRPAFDFASLVNPKYRSAEGMKQLKNIVRAPMGASLRGSSGTGLLAKILRLLGK